MLLNSQHPTLQDERTVDRNLGGLERTERLRG
jgi:hypothetical protein